MEKKLINENVIFPREVSRLSKYLSGRHMDIKNHLPTWLWKIMLLTFKTIYYYIYLAVLIKAWLK